MWGDEGVGTGGREAERVNARRWKVTPAVAYGSGPVGGGVEPRPFGGRQLRRVARAVKVRHAPPAAHLVA